MQYNVHESMKYFPMNWLITMQHRLSDESRKAPMSKVLTSKIPFVFETFLLSVMRKKPLLLKGRTELV
jgi:hypothetical protein